MVVGLLGALSLHAQPNVACMGLKNPTNFTLTGGTGQSSWTGHIGTKNAQASTCTSIGSTFNATLSATALENLSSTTSCTQTLSTDIQGNPDQTRRYVIKGLGYDAQTGNHLSYLPPDSSFTSSIRLGNYCGGREAEQLIYQFTVNNNNKLVTIWYALSLQNGQHNAAENPEFVIRVLKQAGADWVPAAADTLCYVRPTPAGSSSNVSPFYVGSTGSQTGATYGCNIYLPWNKVLINLEKFYTQTIRIEISAGDCSQTAHYACCYIAGECQGMVLNANGCAAGNNSNVATIAAPKGASQYRWYRSKTGVLSGAARANDDSYELIAEANDSVLNVSVNDFIHNITGDTNTQNTFMCKMTTYMNESLPIVSNIYTEVGNMKPRMKVDSILDCNAGITLYNKSFTPFDGNNDSNKVDTLNTVWKIYSGTTASPETLIDSAVGANLHHEFSNAGNHCVRMRTTAFDTSCWNEQDFNIRVVKTPRAEFVMERDSLCMGDSIMLRDATHASTWHQWVFFGPNNVNDTLVSSIQAIRRGFDTTTNFSLFTHTRTFFRQDTNHDGQMDEVYCIGRANGRVQVQNYPSLNVSGDTIVCNGTEASINVAADVEGSSFDWYTSMLSTNPLQSNTATLTTSPTHDIRYYVKARTPFGCEAWDSINIYIVDPQLNVPVTEICNNTPINLYARNAYSYTWTSMPDDPSLARQEHNETITVTPHQNTTYSLVGHGMNNCTTSPLTQAVKVYPYPVPAVEMSPNFIDSEDPTVTFRDVSVGATTSLWDFGGGHTSTERQVRHTFTDLSVDSILVSLTTGNELQCTQDTSFGVPIELFAVWFPNVFTPTMTTNRTFKCFTHNNLEHYSLYIYNREGMQVFYSSDPSAEWDGRFKGEYCPQGAYVYTCTYRRPGTVDIVTQHGTVMLLQ